MYFVNYIIIYTYYSTRIVWFLKKIKKVISISQGHGKNTNASGTMAKVKSYQYGHAAVYVPYI